MICLPVSARSPMKERTDIDKLALALLKTHTTKHIQHMYSACHLVGRQWAAAVWKRAFQVVLPAGECGVGAEQ
jgi:hypothetical protein